MKIKEAFCNAAYWVGDHLFSTGPVMDKYGNNPDLIRPANFMRLPMTKAMLATAYAAAAVETLLSGGTNIIVPLLENVALGGVALSAVRVGGEMLVRHEVSRWGGGGEYLVVRTPSDRRVDPRILTESEDIARNHSSVVLLVTASVAVGAAISGMNATGTICLAMTLASYASHAYQTHQIKTGRWSAMSRQAVPVQKLQR